MEIETPIFGNIILEDVDGQYKYEFRRWKYDFENTVIDIDIHFKIINDENIKRVSEALNSLSKIHKIGKQALRNDFGKSKIVDDYIEEWNEDIFYQMFEEREDFERFIENTEISKTIEERLFSMIRIVRIGIYDESDTSFITMDFAFGYELTFREDMLVVTLNPSFEVTDICTEG